MAIRIGYFTVRHDSKEFLSNLSPEKSFHIFQERILFAFACNTALICIDALLFAQLHSLLKYKKYKQEIIAIGRKIEKSGKRVFLMHSSSCAVNLLMWCVNILEVMELDESHKIIVPYDVSLAKGFNLGHRVGVISSQVQSLACPLVLEVCDCTDFRKDFLKTWMKKDGNPCIMFTTHSWGKYKKEYEYWIKYKVLEELYMKLQNNNIDVILYAKGK